MSQTSGFESRSGLNFWGVFRCYLSSAKRYAYSFQSAVQKHEFYELIPFTHKGQYHLPLKQQIESRFSGAKILLLMVFHLIRVNMFRSVSVADCSDLWRSGQT